MLHSATPINQRGREMTTYNPQTARYELTETQLDRLEQAATASSALAHLLAFYSEETILITPSALSTLANYPAQDLMQLTQEIGGKL